MQFTHPNPILRYRLKMEQRTDSAGRRYCVEEGQGKVSCETGQPTGGPKQPQAQTRPKGAPSHEATPEHSPNDIYAAYKHPRREGIMGRITVPDENGQPKDVFLTETEFMSNLGTLLTNSIRQNTGWSIEKNNKFTSKLYEDATDLEFDYVNGNIEWDEFYEGAKKHVEQAKESVRWRVNNLLKHADAFREERLGKAEGSPWDEWSNREGVEEEHQEHIQEAENALSDFLFEIDVDVVLEDAGVDEDTPPEDVEGVLDDYFGSLADEAVGHIREYTDAIDALVADVDAAYEQADADMEESVEEWLEDFGDVTPTEENVTEYNGHLRDENNRYRLSIDDDGSIYYEDIEDFEPGGYPGFELDHDENGSINLPGYKFLQNFRLSRKLKRRVKMEQRTDSRGATYCVEPGQGKVSCPSDGGGSPQEVAGKPQRLPAGQGSQDVTREQETTTDVGPNASARSEPTTYSASDYKDENQFLASVSMHGPITQSDLDRNGTTTEWDEWAQDALANYQLDKDDQDGYQEDLAEYEANEKLKKEYKKATAEVDKKVADVKRQVEQLDEENQNKLDEFDESVADLINENKGWDNDPLNSHPIQDDVMYDYLNKGDDIADEETITDLLDRKDDFLFDTDQAIKDLNAKFDPDLLDQTLNTLQISETAGEGVKKALEKHREKLAAGLPRIRKQRETALNNASRYLEESRKLEALQTEQETHELKEPQEPRPEDEPDVPERDYFVDWDDEGGQVFDADGWRQAQVDYKEEKESFDEYTKEYAQWEKEHGKWDTANDKLLEKIEKQDEKADVFREKATGSADKLIETQATWEERLAEASLDIENRLTKLAEKSRDQYDEKLNENVPDVDDYREQLLSELDLEEPDETLQKPVPPEPFSIGKEPRIKYEKDVPDEVEYDNTSEEKSMPRGPKGIHKFVKRKSNIGTYRIKGDAQGKPCGPGQNPNRDGCIASDGRTGSGAQRGSELDGKPQEKPDQEQQEKPQEKPEQEQDKKPEGEAKKVEEGRVGDDVVAFDNGLVDTVRKRGLDPDNLDAQGMYDMMLEDGNLPPHATVGDVKVSLKRLQSEMTTTLVDPMYAFGDAERGPNELLGDETRPDDLEMNEMNAIQVATGPGLRKLNQALMTGGKVPGRLKKVVDGLESAFAKADIMDEPIAVKTAMILPDAVATQLATQFERALGSGNPVELEGFTTGIVDADLNSFATSNFVFNIDAYQALDTKPYSHSPQLSSVLLDNLAEYDVKGVRKDENERYVVDLEQRKPKGPVTRDREAERRQREEAKKPEKKSFMSRMKEKIFGKRDDRPKNVKSLKTKQSTRDNPVNTYSEFSDPLKSRSVQQRLANITDHDLFEGQGGGRNDKMLQEIMTEGGRDHVPKVVSKDEMAKLKEEGWTISYRGTKGAVSNGEADQFRNGTNYAGSGILGNGIYVSVTDTQLENYQGRPEVNNDFSFGVSMGYSDGAPLMQVAIPPNARSINVEDLKAERYKFQKDLEEKRNNGQMTQAKFEAAIKMTQDLGRFGTLMNYDAIMSTELQQTYMCVLNRSILAVREDNITSAEQGAL